MNKAFYRNLLFVFNMHLGFFLISYTIYRRILVVRLPRDLYVINNTGINYSLFILLLFSVTICSYIFVKNMQLLLHKESKEHFMSKTFFRLNEVVEIALKDVYSFVGNLIPDPYDKIAFITQKFYKHFKNISETFFLFIFYLIRSIIVVCFLTDIFIFFRLEYMYKALYLLCFSLLIKMLFYILRDFAGNLDEAESLLIIQDKGINPENKLPRTSYSLKEKYNNLDLDYHVAQYILCSKITGYLKIYDRYAAFFNPYFNIIIYAMYIIGWLYALVYNFLTIIL